MHPTLAIADDLEPALVGQAVAEYLLPDPQPCDQPTATLAWWLRLELGILMKIQLTEARQLMALDSTVRQGLLVTLKEEFDHMRSFTALAGIAACFARDRLQALLKQHVA